VSACNCPADLEISRSRLKLGKYEGKSFKGKLFIANFKFGSTLIADLVSPCVRDVSAS